MEENTDNQEQTPQQPSKGYGKRPVWQWVLIYVVVAAVVYGLVYYLFMRDGGANGGGLY